MSRRAIKAFAIHKPSFRSRYDISDAQSAAPVLVAEINTSYNKPDVILHASPDSSSQVIGVAWVHKGMAIVIGDPSQGELTHEVMNGGRSCLSSDHYGFAFTLDNGQRKRLQWEKTGLFSGGRGFRLTDETGNVLAEMKKGMVGTSGTLEMAGIFGRRFETMVFISCLAVTEYKRRKDNRNAAAGSASSSSAVVTG